MDRRRLGRWKETSDHARALAERLDASPGEDSADARRALVELLGVLARDAVPELIAEVRRLERERIEAEALVLEAAATTIAERRGRRIMTLSEVTDYLRTTAKVIRSRTPIAG